MASASTSQPDPQEVLELAAWSQVSDKLVDELVIAQENLGSKQRYAQQVVVCAQESELRASTIVEQSLSFHNLFARFADILSMVRQSNDAVNELLAWKDILETHPLPHRETSMAEKEEALVQSIVKPDTAQLELERQRMEQARDEAKRDWETTMTGLETGQREKLALERQLDSLLLERNGHEQGIHALRVESRDERQRLDGELKDLREQVFAEQQLLQTLKDANTAAALAPAPAAPITSQNGNNGYGNEELKAANKLSPIVAPHMNGGNGSRELRGSVDRQMSPLSPVMGTSSHGAYSPRTPGANSEIAPSLNSGLKALQNVREQLREIRESHNSPTGYPVHGGMDQRQHSYTAGSSSTADFHSSPSSFQRASTSSGTYASGGRAPPLNGHPASLASDDAASPWRQRLSKLQGDLRSLKSELGTSL